ncbi:MAG TPA: hypothetical protein P5237_01795, partial [Candidatus Paceibacterota bacterium]|nr:hypothetical protein [Candidatus Paceibacterota bacterium]
NIQSIIFADAPAVFLYNPKSLIVSVPSLHIDNLEKVGSSVEKYFNVNQWHLKTQRVINED